MCASVMSGESVLHRGDTPAHRFLHHRLSQMLRADYQLSVMRIRDFLSLLDDWIHENGLAEPDDGALKSLTESISPVFMGLAHDFELAAGGLCDDDTPRHVRFAREMLHPLLLQSPFVRRTFEKPLGYPGDYAMVNMMLHNPFRGKTTLGRIVNAMFYGSATVRAHRNRIDYLVNWLGERLGGRTGPAVVRGLNVGCGPAEEIVRLFGEAHGHRPAQLTLMDFSAETLGYARSRIECAAADSALGLDVDFTEHSVMELLKKSRSETPLAPDGLNFIYCAGLFDYFSDRVCARLTRAFYDLLSPGGRLLLTNVHTSNPHRFVMEHLMDWHLYYRDERGMEKMGEAGWSPHITIDSTGVNVFMEVVKD